MLRLVATASPRVASMKNHHGVRLRPDPAVRLVIGHDRVPCASTASARRAGPHGTTGVRDRVEALGGAPSIAPDPGAGTLVSVTEP